MGIHRMKKLLLFSLLIIFVVTIALNLPYGIEAYKLERTIAFNTKINNRDITKIPVLLYHHISEDEKQWGTACISPDKFMAEMLYLKVLGYNAIHFRDYLEYIEQGKSLPSNPIIVSFDDGYLSNYIYAYPVLKQYDIKATIFIIGWSVGRNLNKDNLTPITEHFTWEQAREMYQSGLVEIQSHTYDLHNFADQIGYGLGIAKLDMETDLQYRTRLNADLGRLEELIHQKLDSEVYAFSYPYGNYNQYAESVLRDRGYRFTLTTKGGISDYGKSTYLGSRITMPNEVDSGRLLSYILVQQHKRDNVILRNVSDYKKRAKELQRVYEVQRIYRSLRSILGR